MLLKNKLVVVTGAGSGMGRELALQLLEKGAFVAAVDIHNDALQKLKRDIDGRYQKFLRCYVADISKRENVTHLFRSIYEEQGETSVLINNAGIIQPFVTIEELEYSDIQRVMNVDFFGTLYMIKAFLPVLKLQKKAYIVNISSMGGFLPVPGQSIYGAAKAGIKLMTEGLSAELSETHVHTAVVFPGAVDTHIAENSGIDRADMPGAQADSIQALPADEAAKVIIKGIENDKKRIFVGKDSRMMNFFYRLSPNLAMQMIQKQMKALME